MTLLLYLAFFGWIGWQRGTFQELAVLITAGGSWFLLQSQGGIFVSIANLGGKFVTFLLSGGLGGDSGDAFEALGNAPDVITAANQDIYLFSLWFVLVILVYIATNAFLKSDYRDGWSIILGLANGLVFGAILLPRLFAILVPYDGKRDYVLELGFLDVLGRARDVLSHGLGSLWEIMEPQSSVVLLLLITMLLLLAATSLRGNGGSSEPEAEEG